MGQPVELADVLGRDPLAVRDVPPAVGVVAAAVRAEVEEPAGGVGQHDFARILVLDPDLAAEAAAVAQGLPLGLAQRLERLLAPEAHCQPPPGSACSLCSSSRGTTR